MSQKNYVPLAWLLWRSCRFNVIGFTQLHRSGFSLEFENLFDSIWPVVADLWQIKGKTGGCFKNSTFVVLQKCQNKVSFERNGSGIVLKSLVLILKGWQCFPFITEHFLFFKVVLKSLIRCQSPFFENLLYCDLAREQNKCCF